MKPIDFERYAESFYKKRGYEVDRTPLTNDYGVDLFVSKANERVAVQVKMYGDSTRKINRQMVMEFELVYQVGMLSADEMKSRLFKYVICWYNRHRRHSALGNLSICEFNKKYLDNCNFINAA